MWEERILLNAVFCLGGGKVVFCLGGCVGVVFNWVVRVWIWVIIVLLMVGDCGFGGCWKVWRICWSLKNGKIDKLYKEVYL